jgi:hypothetical protein
MTSEILTKEEVKNLLNLMCAPKVFEIPQYEKDQGFSPEFRKAWQEFVECYNGNEHIWTFTNSAGCQHTARAWLIGTGWADTDIYVDIRHFGTCIKHYKLRDFDSIRSITDADRKKSMDDYKHNIKARTENAEWNLARKLYEFNRQIVDRDGQGLCVMQDDNRESIAWDDIPKKNYVLMDDYCFVASELLKGLVS